MILGVVLVNLLGYITRERSSMSSTSIPSSVNNKEEHFGYRCREISEFNTGYGGCGRRVVGNHIVPEQV